MLLLPTLAWPGLALARSRTPDYALRYLCTVDSRGSRPARGTVLHRTSADRSREYSYARL